MVATQDGIHSPSQQKSGVDCKFLDVEHLGSDIGAIADFFPTLGQEMTVSSRVILTLVPYVVLRTYLGNVDEQTSSGVHLLSTSPCHLQVPGSLGANKITFVRNNQGEGYLQADETEKSWQTESTRAGKKKRSQGPLNNHRYARMRLSRPTFNDVQSWQQCLLGQVMR